MRIHATAVTRSDCYVRSFQIPEYNVLQRAMARLALGVTKPRRPILGLVFAGEVDLVGRSVTRFRTGDRLFAFTMLRFGAYAEFTCLPETAAMAPMPAGLTYEEAASLPYGGPLALHFLRKGGIRSGQKVLIYGASGAVGTTAVQLAKHFGAEVNGVCGASNLDLVRSLGAEQVIDYTTEDFAQRSERYDLVFDAVGKISEAHARNALAPGGAYVSVEGQGGPKVRSEDLVELKGIVEAGHLKVVIDRTYPLEQIVEAHRYVDRGHKKGNVAITVTDRPSR